MIVKPNNNDSEYDAPASTAPKSKQKARGAGFALFIAALALFFTAAGIAAGYKHWQRMHDRAKSNAKKIEVLETLVSSKPDSKTLTQLRQEILTQAQEHTSKTTDALQQMQQIQTQTEQFATTVTSQVEQITTLQARLQNSVAPETGKDWQLAEVKFLLKLAVRELSLSNNQDAAQAALQQADQLLSELGSVSYLPVRQQIARDLATLSNIDAPDLTELSGRIDQFARQLQPGIRTIAASNEDKVVPDAETDQTPAPEKKWSTYKRQALDTLGQLVVVRQANDPIAASLSSDARKQLFNLLQLRLESLRLMMLQQRDQAYQNQLKLLRETIDNYYSTEKASQLHMVLDDLAEITLQPHLPDISGSLRHLETVQATHAGVSQ